MKSISIHLLCLLLALAFAPSCSKKTNPEERALYTCGMHPQVVQDHPGNCPICGMRLVPQRKQPSPARSGASGKQTDDRKIKYYKSTMLLGEISKTPRKDSMGMDMVPVHEGEEESTMITVNPTTVQKMGFRSALVTKGPLRRMIRTVGAIDYNETALADVTTKFRGWIENLYVDSTGKQVHKGEPLFDIYSPDLYSAQNEYVLALNQTGASGMKNSARQKLRLFDISENQITELERSRQAQRTLRVDAPIDGIVVEKMAVRGQMVEAGMKLYRLADLSIVWVQSQIYEQDLALLQLGQEAEVSLSYLPDRKFRGRVTYIYPTVDEKTRTARVRMEFHNPGLFLKPGMFATVELRAELKPDALLVPDSAVLRSGEKNTVFVALDGGHFEPRDVVLGTRADSDAYEVLSGLREGEQVVTSGQFMLDSESQLREAIQKMLKPVAPGASAQAAVQTRNASVPVQPTPVPESKAGPQEYVCPTGYACPMPDHMSIKYNHAGKCPICGMTLIPAPEGGTMPTPSPTASPPEHQH
jgi:membrane fusion protein, copper/silver efflux system